MFLKNRNISSKIKRSKVTDYAALKGVNHEQAAFLVAAAHDLHLLSFESW